MLQWHIGLSGHLISWHFCNSLYKALRTLHSIYLFIEVNMTWSIKSDHYIKGRINCWDLVVWICDDESCSLLTDCVTQSMRKALHYSRNIFFGLAFPPFQSKLHWKPQFIQNCQFQKLAYCDRRPNVIQFLGFP